LTIARMIFLPVGPARAVPARGRQFTYPPMCTWYCAPFERLQVPVPWKGVVIR